MQIDWKAFGKKAVIIAAVGVTLTTAILIYRHVKNKREEKKSDDKIKDENSETNQSINKELVKIATEDDLKRTARELEDLR
jgi:hypothetical protein